MEYGKAFGFVQRNPKWLNAVGIGCLCQLVPIAGPLVWEGYQYRVTQDLHHGRTDYPDFDTNRLSEYLRRGLWPFVVVFLVSMVFGVLVGGAYAVVAILAAVTQSGVLAGVGLLVLGLLAFFGSFAVGVFVQPMMLYAGLRQSFDWQGSWQFTRDFHKKVGGQNLAAVAVLMMVGVPAGFLGLMLCCVGIYPVGAWLSFAQHHMQYQLYELYLQRGGAPVPEVLEEIQDADEARPA